MHVVALATLEAQSILYSISFFPTPSSFPLLFYSIHRRLLALPSSFFPHSRFVPESFINSFAFYTEDVYIDYFLFLYDGKEEYIWRIEIEFQEIWIYKMIRCRTT